jgi:hypothetical protein
LTQVQQTGQAGGNSVQFKLARFSYNQLGQYASVRR